VKADAAVPSTLSLAGGDARGFGVLRLSPAAFWAMTPRELAAAIEALSRGGRPLDRDGFAALMRRYPDDRRHA